MKSVKCSGCGTEGPLNSYFYVNNKLLCEPCADKHVQDAEGSAIPPEVRRGQDLTICARCGSDGGSIEHEVISGAPFCQPCKESILAYPCPQWLKIGLAFSLLLLVGALFYGQKYFRAGKSLYRGERLINQRQYEAAAVELRKTLQVAPDCEQCILMLAKADLLAGTPEEAYRVIDAHNGGQFKNSALGDEVSALFKKSEAALTLLEQAQKEIQEHKSQQALVTIDNAQKAYPELQGLQYIRNAAEIDVAFTTKDYDRFAAIAEASHKSDPQSSYFTALYSSAIACQYAATGDEKLKTRAESLLAEAEVQVKTDEERKNFTEYSERIKHRLATREVIDKEEYNRRYRPASQKVKEQ